MGNLLLILDSWFLFTVLNTKGNRAAMVFSAELSVLLPIIIECGYTAVVRFIIRRLQTSDMFHCIQTVRKKWSAESSAAVSAFDPSWQPVDYTGKSPRINRNFQSADGMVAEISADITFCKKEIRRGLDYETFLKGRKIAQRKRAPFLILFFSKKWIRIHFFALSWYRQISKCAPDLKKQV